MQNPNYRVVLDTNEVVGAGTGWLDHGVPVSDKNPHRRVLICVAQSHTGLYSGKIVGEYLEKLVDLGHPKERAMKMITYLMGAFSQVNIVSKSAPYPPSDPDDEIFVICALDGQANYLVSEDHAILALTPKYSSPIIGKCVDLAGHLGA